MFAKSKKKKMLSCATIKPTGEENLDPLKEEAPLMFNCSVDTFCLVKNNNFPNLPFTNNKS